MCNLCKRTAYKRIYQKLNWSFLSLAKLNRLFPFKTKTCWKVTKTTHCITVRLILADYDAVCQALLIDNPFKVNST